MILKYWGLSTGSAEHFNSRLLPANLSSGGGGGAGGQSPPALASRRATLDSARKLELGGVQGGRAPPPSLVDEQLSTQPANLSSGGGGGAGGAHYPFARASRKASPELRTFGKNCRGASTRIMLVTLFGFSLRPIKFASVSL